MVRPATPDTATPLITRLQSALLAPHPFQVWQAQMDLLEKEKLITCDFDVHPIKMANKQQYEYRGEKFFYFLKLPTRFPIENLVAVRQS